MPVKSIIEQYFSGAEKNLPASTEIAISNMTSMFSAYFLTAKAGVTLPAFSTAQLQTDLLNSANSQSLMKDLGIILQKWCQTFIWAGPGFSGVTTLVPPLDTDNIGNQVMNGSPFPSTFANAVDLWTKSIFVTLTSASGATSVVSVM